MGEFLSITTLPAQTMPTIGEKGEAMAADHLVEQGYRLVIANFKAPVGRNRKGVQVTGEIDLIAIERDTLCFIEVKTRRSDAFTPIVTNVDLRKQRQITRTAKVYRRLFAVERVTHRFDVVTVLLPMHSLPEIDLIRGFWSESKFRKQTWHYSAWCDFV